MVLSEQNKKDILYMYSEEKVGCTTISRRIGVNENTIASYIRRTIGTRSRSAAAKKYTCDETFFENIDTEEKAYWLGFFYADGYVTTSGKYNNGTIGLTISEKDYGHLCKFKNSINATNPIKHYKTGKSSFKQNVEYCRLLIRSDKLYSDIVKQGVVEHKTNIITPPNISKDLVRHFVRGYIDGDGCISKTDTETHPLSYAVKILGTEQVLDFIKNFIHEYTDIKIGRYFKRKECQTVSSLEFSGNVQVEKFLDIIYKNATVFLDRKHERYIELKELLTSRAEAKASCVKSPKLLELQHDPENQQPTL